AMDNRRLCRMQSKAKGEAFIDRLQLLLFAAPLNAPISVPDPTVGFAHACDSRTGAIDTFILIKTAAVQVAQSQMSEVQIADVPTRRVCQATADALAKKCQLETEAMAVRGTQVAGVIPPFRLKVGMIEMIAWKFVVIVWQRRSISRHRLRKRE